MEKGFRRTTSKSWALIALAFSVTAMLLAPAHAWAVSAFLKIDGVQGESDGSHPNEIAVLSYHWGASYPVTGTVSSTGNISGQRVNMDPLTITKHLDKASPLLAQNCAEGKVFPTATLSLYRDSGGQKIMEYKLTNAMVSSVQIGGTAQGNDLPVEEVGLSFTKIDLTYTKIGQGGTPAGNTMGSWDLSKNTK